MDREEVEKAILEELGRQQGKVLTRNAVRALFACFKDPIGSLGQLFGGMQRNGNVSGALGVLPLKMI